MKILHVLDSLRVGGSESLSATLAGAFRERGVDGLVCGLGQDGPLRDRLARANVQCMSLRKASGVRPDLMARLTWLMLARRCDAVITHHFRQLVHAVPGAAVLRRRLVHVEHDHHSHENQPHILAHFGRIAPLVSRFVFVSDAVRDWFVERAPQIAHKAVVITNGVDTDRFVRDQGERMRVRALVGAGQDDFVVGTCARLEPVKDLELLLRGFAQMKQHPNIRRSKLVLVGDGSLRTSLEATAAAFGVVQDVHFTGMVDDVPAWLSGFDAYAMTSVNEGLPLSVMEAMSCSLPVVATDVGSLSRVVDDRVGFLLQTRRPDELADRLVALAGDPGLSQNLGLAARGRAELEYSIETMVQAYLLALGLQQPGGDSI
ncbi:Putative glycosyltransferase EpsD [Fundidesulfovibrio magnetotacticus]|uniref:Glycosyltransferase EpsD n=1 Tax=Fundidesulfovibrio magnetotacticus TaxID=2730080 RepID=A0A6V8LW67_9BACT|nr:glycosyltransferase [Fundidesulfovibrio magnetotacticus]GFK93907.1 Putative glycosyltransferase EpsD [Fundidesulfovibrio magnetotacticus]